MKLGASTLEDIEKDQKAFCNFFTEYALTTLERARLHPRLAPARLVDVHGAWCHDMKRVSNHEPHIEDGLDHFKRAAHLAFWVRRFDPVVEAVDLTKNLADAEGYGLTDAERDFRSLLYGYVNEYLAFDIAYQFCRYYESHKTENPADLSKFNLDREYVVMVCNFLKYKSVSPHALTVVLKSLFFGRQSPHYLPL